MTTIQQMAAWVLRRHIGRRHPGQSWRTRWLLRRMDLPTLAMIHLSEHEVLGEVVGHDVGDFTDVTDADD